MSSEISCASSALAVCTDNLQVKGNWKGHWTVIVLKARSMI